MVYNISFKAIPDYWAQEFKLSYKHIGGFKFQLLKWALNLQFNIKHKVTRLA